MAGGLHLHRHAHGRAVERVVERDPHARFEIDATLRPRPLWPAAPAPEEAAEPAEQIREVTEIDVLDPNVPEAAERPRAGLTERVVLLALLRVREQVVRRLDVLEALLGGGVSGVAVGMELSRQLAARLLDLVLRRRPPNAERAVRIGHALLRDHDPRRAQHPVAEAVALLHDF